MSKKEAFKLIVENIEMLDDACQLVANTFDEELFLAIYNVIKENISQHYDSESIFSIDDNNIDIRFYPTSWNNQHNKSKSNSIGYFYFNFSSDEFNESGSYFRISPLFSNTKESIGLVFHVNMLTKKDKKTLITQDIHNELAKLGFKFNKAYYSFYLPIKPLNPQLVIENYPDTLEDAMDPIREALETLKKAHPIFDKIVEDAKKYFDEV